MSVYGRSNGWDVASWFVFPPVLLVEMWGWRWALFWTVFGVGLPNPISWCAVLFYILKHATPTPVTATAARQLPLTSILSRAPATKPPSLIL